MEERNNLLPQILSITHLVSETETVIGAAIALDIDFAASEKLLQVVEKRSVVCPQFQTETRLDLRSATIRGIQMNSKASLAVHQTNHIISRQHQVFPFGQVSYYGIS